MSKIVINNSQEFERLINNFELYCKNIVDILNNEKKNVTSINSTDVWSGNAQEALYGKYQMLEKNFSPIEQTFQIYVKFLRNTLEAYKSIDKKLNNDVEANIGNLNVNS